MSALIVGIDAGHGGTNTGTEHNGIIEKDYTLEMAPLFAEALDEAGYQVVLSRTDDETMLHRDRALVFESADVDLGISLHVNALPGSPTTGGFMAFHWPGNRRTHEAACAAARAIRAEGRSPLWHKHPVQAASPDWGDARAVVAAYPMDLVLFELFHATNPEAAAFAQTDEGKHLMVAAGVAAVGRWEAEARL